MAENVSAEAKAKRAAYFQGLTQDLNARLNSFKSAQEASQQELAAELLGESLERLSMEEDHVLTFDVNVPASLEGLSKDEKNLWNYMALHEGVLSASKVMDMVNSSEGKQYKLKLAPAKGISFGLTDENQAKVPLFVADVTLHSGGSDEDLEIAFPLKAMSNLVVALAEEQQ